MNFCVRLIATSTGDSGTDHRLTARNSLSRAPHRGRFLVGAIEAAGAVESPFRFANNAMHQIIGQEDDASGSSLIRAWEHHRERLRSV
jgi:hypothetical protein